MTALRVDIVILACAISAGIHGALAPEHFGEAIGAGAGFVAATVLLVVLVVALPGRPTRRVAAAAAAAVLAGLIASYSLAVATGLPLLHPEPEGIDRLALFTKAVEAGGLTAASSLLWRRPAGALTLEPKGT